MSVTNQDLSAVSQGQMDNHHIQKRLKQRLAVIYPELIAIRSDIENEDNQIDELTKKIIHLCDQTRRQRGLDSGESTTTSLWSEQDILLITYGDSIVQTPHPASQPSSNPISQPTPHNPLQILDKFSNQYLSSMISTIHILPFFPFSSDDGFSVVDYHQVNPNLGDWRDIRKLRRSFKLMMDLVINHCSRENLWFSDYVADLSPFNEFFIEVDPQQDTSLVTRPRNSPLLSPVHTHRGIKHLWATFSDDQIDLNFKNPKVLVEIIRVFLLYIEQGAGLIRLDAVAFLWKELGTRCVHLPQTHEIVKLLRDILQYAAPDVVLITETNVPVKENLAYFGEGDEAHMVYQFGLPPLILHALNRGHARYLTDWAASIPHLPPGCTYLNFTASHDGIGVRPIEGILPAGELKDLLDCMHRFGGFVSTKANEDGSQSPYEINITYYDACMGTRLEIDQWQTERFLCSQTIMLAMQGIPAFYIQSLLACPNDLEGVEKTGRTRSINRRQWQEEEVDELLRQTGSPTFEVFNELKRIAEVRRLQPAFHPNAGQEVISISSDLFVLHRHQGCSAISSESDNKLSTIGAETPQSVYAIANVTNRSLQIPLSTLTFLPAEFTDLLNQNADLGTDCLSLSPYQNVWLTAN